MSSPAWVRKGACSEYLAQYFLSRVGFVVPVPRQEDYFKVDFIVHLAKEDDKGTIPTGKCFAIQVKSNDDPEPFAGDGLKCLSESELPFFWGVVDMKRLKLRIYTTLSRFCFGWKIGRAQPFTLCPGGEYDDFARIDYDGGDRKVWTGPPILELDANDLDDPNKQGEWRKRFFDVMTAWVGLEAMAISWRQQDFPIVILPKHFETNNPVFARLDYRVFANPSTLPMVCKAMKPPLLSLGYYLHDFLKRLGGHVDPATMGRVRQIDRAVEQVKAGVRMFAPD